MKLRWVGWSHRTTKAGPQIDSDDNSYVLQQWWTKDDAMKEYEDIVGEWRDVPLENE